MPPCARRRQMTTLTSDVEWHRTTRDATLRDRWIYVITLALNVSHVTSLELNLSELDCSPVCIVP